MADIVLSSVVDGIIRGLGSAAVNEIALLWGISDELSKLHETISTIKAVLLDAEKKQTHNNEVRAWLERLENVFYDADDLVDEFDTEAALRKQLEGSEMMTVMRRQVRTFFSSSNQLALRHKLGRKIKAIRDRLEAIRKERKFHLDETCEETKVESNRARETHSDKPDKEVIGRDKDKMAIVECLLDPIIEENLCVVPIVGCGGLGKTTLAKLVFNDDKIERHFNLKIWVFVSNNDFNVRVVIEKILKSVINQKDNFENLKMDQLQKGSLLNKDIENLEMDQLQKYLHKEIVGKRYLLVLDDVWNENRELWLELKGFLAKCRKGSRIIITTRSKVVAEITSTMKPYVLERLDKEESWSLFKNVAFRHDHMSNDSQVSDIGREIVDKCGGIPLAIRTIGRMLYNKNPNTEWSSFLKKEFSTIGQEKCDILPTLKLSYDNLPSHLKRCFAFCKLYPKGHEIGVRVLIALWMALGFISKSSHQTQVDLGYGYYQELLRGSFFQEEFDDCYLYKRCKMHDLMHDLATQVGGTMYALFEANGDCDGDADAYGSTRHISFNGHLDSLWQIQISQSQASKIRTVVLPRQSTNITQGRSAQSICDEFFSSLKVARVLHLFNLGIKVVPRCVGKLKHLRFLDLGYNEDIKALPDCITMLYNLQTLLLFGCKNLQNLPRNMGSLVNLVNLDTDDCESLTHMPQGFNNLTKLQYLTYFVLKSLSSDGDQAGELRDLRRLNLGGSIKICNLGNGEDTRNANLNEKRDLQSLCLSWRGDHNYYSRIRWHSEVESDVELPLYLKDVDYEAALEGLQPHQNLRGLTLEYYEGVRFSSWLPSLANLELLSILNSRNCQYLPPMNQFVCLKVLKMVNVVGLEYISEKSSSSCTTSPLPSLEEIYFESLPNLKGWWKNDEGGQDDCSSSASTISFPHLVEFESYSCPRLAFLPLSPHLKSLTVGKNNWEPFHQALMASIIGISPSSSSSSSSSFFSNLTHLGLHKIEHLHCLPESFQNLTSLEVLIFVHCHNLKHLSPGIQYLVSSLQELRICACYELEMNTEDFPWKAFENLRLLLLRELPEMVHLPKGLRHLTSLQNLDVYYCENLRQIPHWIGNLKSLNKVSIDGGPNLMSIPEGISQLTSLQELKITDCSDILVQRCQKGNGEDWPKVAHIPELILEPASNDQDEGSTWKIFKKLQIPKFSRN